MYWIFDNLKNRSTIAKYRSLHNSNRSQFALLTIMKPLIILGVIFTFASIFFTGCASSSDSGFGRIIDDSQSSSSNAYVEVPLSETDPDFTHPTDPSGNGDDDTVRSPD